MFALTAKRSLAAMVCSAALMFGSPAAAAGLSIRALGAQQLHVATIGYRIAAANPRSCARPDMMTGMVLHDLTQYGPAARPAVSRAFSLNSGFGVLGLVPGGAAVRAGLVIDDEILAVGGRWVTDPSASQRRAPSFQRMSQFSALLDATLRNGATSLVVRRNGQQLNLQLQGQPGCGGDVALSNSSSLNAWSDGRHVMVTTAMTQFARSDDQLAFVIAHEMAHNSLGHASSGSGDALGLFSMLGIGAAGARRMEMEADGQAVMLMSAGGYAPEAGIAFLQIARRKLWWSVSLDHPGFGQRMAIVGNAIARLSTPAYRYARQQQVVPVPSPLPAARTTIVASQATSPAIQSYAVLVDYKESANRAFMPSAQLAAAQSHLGGRLVCER